MAEKILLEMKNISKYFPGTKALSDVSLTVKKGEVHSLVGENGAGKSTLMKIVGGVLSPEEGEIYFDGKKIDFKNPKEAQEAGVGLVHQELSLCQHMTVAENIFIGRLPRKKSGMIDFKKLYHDSQELLDMFGVKFTPRKIAGELSVSEQQIVELAKSMSLQCKLLILDEPTSALTKVESEILFNVIKMLTEQDISILYISHRMEEIIQLSDSSSVLRDGTYRGTLTKGEINEDKLIHLMVGREITNRFADSEKDKDKGNSKNVLLQVKDFENNNSFNNISFTLYQGEILGFSGLVGAGRTEVMRAICGIDKKTNGSLFLESEQVDFRTYEESIKKGIVYVTEDRKDEGLFLSQSIRNNITASILKKISPFAIIKKSKEREISNNYVKSLNIKISDINHTVESLSGGNQQKVVLAKWLATNPKVLILDEPTRGIDIGAKVEIYTLLRELAEQGIGVIVISSELPEIIGICDRVAVMHEGKVTGIVEDSDINEEEIMKLASGIA